MGIAAVAAAFVVDAYLGNVAMSLDVAWDVAACFLVAA